MDSPERTNVRRPTRLSIAAVVGATLTVTMVGASAASPSARSEPSCSQVTCVFVLDNGKFTGFDAPGPALQDLVRINNKGEIVGGTREAVADEGFRGFLRDRRGDVTRIDFPGAAAPPNDINDRRQIVGRTATPTCTGCADDKRGFLLDRGRFTTIHVPDQRKRRPSASTTAVRWWASISAPTAGSTAFGGTGGGSPPWTAGRRRGSLDINDRGQIVGVFANDPTVGLPGFLLTRAPTPRSTPPAPGPPSPLASTTAGRSWSPRPPACSRRQGFLLRKGAEGPFTPSTLRAWSARPEPCWPPGSTTQARSSASTPTPMRRRTASAAPCRCR